MFKQLAADALGLSDIGKIISPENYNKVDSDDYIFHEDGEKIYFIIKSKMDEYCFTNLALIHVDGQSAMSKKRTVRRYDYYKNNFNNVTIETAGTIDLDCEIKFSVGDKYISIDVDKNQIEQLKDLYKSLTKIGQIMDENQKMLTKMEESLKVAENVTGASKGQNGTLAENFEKVNDYVFRSIEEARKKYIVKDFGTIFSNYIAK